MIAIVDYGSGNVGAIADVFRQLKVPHKITNDLDELRAADRYILPGVGAFDTTMRTLRQSGLIEVLDHEVLVSKKKILGICVGMQILGESSEEGDLPGLGWISGRIRKIDKSKINSSPKLPHMGWNSIRLNSTTSLFSDVDVERGFYFLHSYYFDANLSENVLATVEYGESFPCGVISGNVIGLQFHPEKSHSNGIAIFRNFAEF